MLNRRSLPFLLFTMPLIACASRSGSTSETSATEATSQASEEGDTGAESGSMGETGEPNECSLGEWQGNTVDNRPPSADPPCDFTPDQVPMFVVLGWDDNAEADGMDWSVQVANAHTNADGSPVKFTYYNTSTYADAAGSSWKAAYDAGHEMGNHTITHTTSNNTDAATWDQEMQGCHDSQVGLGIAAGELYGFRAPFLSTSDDTISAVQEMGYWYDCSLEEGYQYDQDGTNFLWPYTLNNGSPGNDLVADEWQSAAKDTVHPHPGLWEMPSYALMVPDDEACTALGIEPGLQQRIKDNIMASEGWEWSPPKITGFDYNLWYSGRVTGEEFTAILKHNLDLRLQGNRAPFLVGTHTSYYVPSWDTSSPNADNAARRAAVEAFVEYAVSLPDVRVTTAKETLDWVRNPEAL